MWKAEQAAEAEKQKVQQVIKEKKMEREREEMARMQEEAGGKKRNVQKVEWMYNNVNARGVRLRSYLMLRSAGNGGGWELRLRMALLPSDIEAVSKTEI